ncbi:MAG: hypothetical protein P8M20_09710 [Planctomycetaceae bacterium]|nr:hypothetical protein [Planctomycetaceae bacterium]
MRLTLRTLLAYLDDLLEAGQSREIGEKISESGYASTLVDRIREVMRRRRLTAPDPKSPNSGLDTNSIAEYLDNTLEPDAVADVEKVCLDSDVHLAEVAASHQILTLVLGEPVDVPTRTRERMYALGPTTKPIKSSTLVDEEGDSQFDSDTSVTIPSHPAAKESKSPSDTNGETFTKTIPDYLKPVPLWRRMAPVAVGVLVGAVWLAVVYVDPSIPLGKSLDNGNTVAQIDPGTDLEVSSEGPISNDPGLEAAIRTTPAQESEPEVVATNKPSRDITQLNGYDPDTPPATTAATLPMPAVPSSQADTELAITTPQPATPTLPDPSLQPVGTSVAAVTSPVTVGSSVSAPSTTVSTTTPAAVLNKPQTVVTPTVPAPELLYTSRDGVLVRKTDEDWLTMPHRTAIRAGDRVASLEPFSALLEISALDLLIELKGGTVIEYLGATADEQVSLQLLSGRISMQRRSPDTNTERLVVGLHLLDEPCRFTLQSQSALCGAELNMAEANGYEKDLGEDRYTGGLFVVNGQVGFVGKLAGHVALTGPSWFPLTPVDRRAMAESDEQPPLLTVPAWLDASSSRISSTQRRYSSRFQNEIDEEQPLKDSIPSIVKSKIPAISELAVKTMAITSMHNELVQALAEAEFLEARNAAIAGLRQWLPAASENREIMRAALQRHFSADQVDTLYRLLWGYSEDDARNPATSRLLVDWLGHDSQVIRQLAFNQVYRLTGQRYDFRPINPANQRKTALDRWYSHLERNDGKLLK